MSTIALSTADKLLATVAFRERLLNLQDKMVQAVAKGAIPNTLPQCTVKHTFTPKDDKFGCYTYAREMIIPADTYIIGKLHRHKHLNIISKGKVSVITEHGPMDYEGPCVFVSEVGTKRAVYAHTETVWTTIHTVSYGSEADLPLIEQEVIAEDYAALGLIATTKELTQMQHSNTLMTEAGAA